SRGFLGKAKAFTRTERPPRCYLIDSGLSRKYDPNDGPPLELPVRGGDKTAPEHRNREVPCNPSPPTSITWKPCSVVLHAGSKIQRIWVMKSLVADMVQEDPSKRTTMDQVVSRFARIRRRLSTWKLCSRIKRKSEIPPVTL
ncbi:hypothetical protein BC834DRAFT_839665, partial [Gloeopeniophorella convolvens]